MAATETPTALGPCPTDEDLAAFLDGMLPEAERSRVIAHLADCRKCYRIFAESLHFLTKEAEIVQFPFAKRALRRWVPIAAAAVLLVGVGSLGYFWAYVAPPPRFLAGLIVPPQIKVAQLTASLPSKSASAENLYPFKTYRGGQGGNVGDFSSDGPSFMLGVLTVDLRLAPYAKDPSGATSSTLQQIGKELRRSGLMDDWAGRYEQDASKARESVAFVHQLRADLPRREEDLDDMGEAFAFGKWAEAGRLAALAKAPGFFTNWNNQRFLKHTLHTQQKAHAERQNLTRSSDEFDPEAEREEATITILQRIEASVERDGLPSESDFRELIRLYEDAG
jgi:hypothetical protein